MSLDKSLKSRASLERHRNVLTRAERIAHLQEVGRWKEDSTPTGLPKVAHRKASVGKKSKAEKKPEQAAETAEAPADEEKKS
ncbi:MAG: small basic protein [Phycisphaerae bacterium]|jgi:small basic protein (TIGR04137 family)